MMRQKVETCGFPCLFMADGQTEMTGLQQYKSMRYESSAVRNLFSRHIPHNDLKWTIDNHSMCFIPTDCSWQQR